MGKGHRSHRPVAQVGNLRGRRLAVRTVSAQAAAVDCQSAPPQPASRRSESYSKALVTGRPQKFSGNGTPNNHRAVAAVSYCTTSAVTVNFFFTPLPQALRAAVKAVGSERNEDAGLEHICPH